MNNQNDQQNSSLKFLEDYLETIATKFSSQKTIEAIVWKMGRSFTPLDAPRPHGVYRGKSKECYSNAYRLADDIKYRYVEGFAISDIGILLPIQHAWVTDKKGNVIETTWPKSGFAYYGIPFGQTMLNKIISETGTFGVLDFTSKTFRKYYEENME